MLVLQNLKCDLLYRRPDCFLVTRLLQGTSTGCHHNHGRQKTYLLELDWWLVHKVWDLVEVREIRGSFLLFLELQCVKFCKDFKRQEMQHEEKNLPASRSASSSSSGTA